MANISDIIEEFITEMLDGAASVSISRNELAQYFNCAPSQINYVLSTRFTVDRGFVTDSKRGGGGYILLTRINAGYDELLERLQGYAVTSGITFRQACEIVEYLTEEKVLTKTEALIIQSAVTDKALLAPTGNKEILRASILKNIIINLIKEDLKS
ncbi:MAG: CtsR family transcriptional regulator [Clostridiales bacterium]|nr:CtsR family transcriptional regulator [Clostridiales bacterium]